MIDDRLNAVIEEIRSVDQDESASETLEILRARIKVLSGFASRLESIAGTYSLLASMGVNVQFSSQLRFRIGRLVRELADQFSTQPERSLTEQWLSEIRREIPNLFAEATTAFASSWQDHVENMIDFRQENDLLILGADPANARTVATIRAVIAQLRTLAQNVPDSEEVLSRLVSLKTALEEARDNLDDSFLDDAMRRFLAQAFQPGGVALSELGAETLNALRDHGLATLLNVSRATHD